jgi:NAD(P)-dependent dehydrogenase (short-subunit alcohol dehydrogenase family)
MEVALCTDVEAARALLEAGQAVVLVGADSEHLGRVAATLRSEGPGGRRVAVVAGDPADHAVRQTALTLAAEVFGAGIPAEKGDLKTPPNRPP